MTRKKAAPPAPGPKVGKRSGNVRLVIQVRPDQVDALVVEATRRRPPGGVRADTSAVVRDAIDAYPPLKLKR